MSENDRVKIYYLLSDGDKAVTEINTDVFLQYVKLIKSKGEYILGLGPVQLAMPAGATKKIIYDLVTTLDEKDVFEVMEIMEREFKKQTKLVTSPRDRRLKSFLSGTLIQSPYVRELE